MKKIMRLPVNFLSSLSGSRRFVAFAASITSKFSAHGHPPLLSWTLNTAEKTSTCSIGTIRVDMQLVR